MKPSRSAASNPPCPAAADILAYMPLVHQVVARFIGKLPPNVLREDLVGAGTFGLIDALRKHPSDAERGPAFEWYARVRIRGSIVDELRTQDWLSRRARTRMTEAATASGTTLRAAVISFDDLPNAAQGMNIADDSAPSPLDLVEESCDRHVLRDAVATLPERERNIVTMHYFQGVQFKAIASALGVSEPRISQLHARAVGLLRAALSTASAA